VLGRRRYAVSGHFGLRASPGGVATPAFGPEPEALRLSATHFIREVGNQSSGLALHGASLAGLARFADADLACEFSAGPQTPDIGSTTDPLYLPGDELAPIFEWFELAWRVLDTVAAGVPGGWTQSTVQLWPEHFDVGTSLDFGRGDGAGVNLGLSAGDAFSEEPYVYIGPWGEARPGDPHFWNASFGAFLPRTEAGDAEACVDFLRSGLARVSEA
jgi:hypothetical protein